MVSEMSSSVMSLHLSFSIIYSIHDDDVIYSRDQSGGKVGGHQDVVSFHLIFYDVI